MRSRSLGLICETQTVEGRACVCVCVRMQMCLSACVWMHAQEWVCFPDTAVTTVILMWIYFTSKFTTYKCRLNGAHQAAYVLLVSPCGMLGLMRIYARYRWLFFVAAGFFSHDKNTEKVSAVWLFQIQFVHISVGGWIALTDHVNSFYFQHATTTSGNVCVT